MSASDSGGDLLAATGERPVVNQKRQSTSPVAVVTGGPRRLGRRLCKGLAARGYDVVILYRESEAEARSLEAEIAEGGRRARALMVDVGLHSQVARVFEEIAREEGRVDLLVNNVGNSIRNTSPSSTQPCGMPPSPRICPAPIIAATTPSR